MGEDLCDGLGLGEERDEREWRLAGWTDQRKHFIDPSQQGRPPGGSGRDGIGCFRCWHLGLGGGRRDLWGRCGETIEADDLGGESIVLLGPFGDEGSQGRIGGKDPVVTVTVDAGWREDGGQPIQKLQSRETQGRAASGVGLGQDVEDLVRAAADQVEAFEGEGWPGAITDEPLQAVAVGGLKADAPIEAKTAAVLPRQHVPGVVGLQEAVADHVSEDPFSHRVLEAVQEFVGESRGFVETEVGFWVGGWILSRVTLNLLEEPIHDDEMKVKMRIEA